MQTLILQLTLELKADTVCVLDRTGNREGSDAAEPFIEERPAYEWNPFATRHARERPKGRFALR